MYLPIPDGWIGTIGCFLGAAFCMFLSMQLANWSPGDEYGDAKPSDGCGFAALKALLGYVVLAALLLLFWMSFIGALRLIEF